MTEVPTNKAKFDRPPKVVASIEARMTSSRLPGKVLAPLAGIPAFLRLVGRLQACARVDEIILATTDRPTDDPLVETAKAHCIAYHRGSEDDVLLRVVEAHRKAQSDIVVEITGDCPLIDPELVDFCIDSFLLNDCDYLATHLSESYPRGMDVQVFGFTALEWVEKNVADSAVREHVSLYFYEHPERYRIHSVPAPTSVDRPHYRLTLDYPEDLELIDSIYCRLEPRLGPNFGLLDVVGLLDAEPAIASINSGREQRAPR